MNKAINHALTPIILFSEWQIGSSFYVIDCESQCVTVKANKMCLACQWGSLVDESIESFPFELLICAQILFANNIIQQHFMLWTIQNSYIYNFKSYLKLFHKITPYVLSFVYLPFCFLFTINILSVFIVPILPLTGLMDSWIADL